MAITGLGSTDGMSCGCGGARATSGFGLSPDGLGLSPDGLGISPDGLGDASSSPILGGKITGSSWLDAALGAGLGYAFAPSKSRSSKGEEFVYAAAGAAALGLLGIPGLIGAVALKIVSKAK